MYSLIFAAEIRAAQWRCAGEPAFKHFRVIDQDFADVPAQVITEGTHDDVTFLMDKERRRAAFSGF